MGNIAYYGLSGNRWISVSTCHVWWRTPVFRKFSPCAALQKLHQLPALIACHTVFRNVQRKFLRAILSRSPCTVPQQPNFFIFHFWSIWESSLLRKTATSYQIWRENEYLVTYYECSFNFTCVTNKSRNLKRKLIFSCWLSATQWTLQFTRFPTLHSNQQL